MRLSALLYDAYKNWCEANIFRAYTLILIKYIGKERHLLMKLFRL